MIRVERTYHVALFYHVLAQLDLGRDAANLYRQASLWERMRSPRWTKRAVNAYRAAAGRLTVHALPLVVGDLDALLAWLRSPRGSLADAAGTRLCEVLAEALGAEHQTFELPPGPEIDGALVRRLDELHEALWSARRRPALLVHDAPALRDGEFTHGRAVTLSDGQVVAVSMEAEPVMAAIQVFHETIHAITDADVDDLQHRDTAVGSDGYRHHIELERAAVEHGRDLIADVAPGWSEHYARWCARYGM